MDTSKKYIEMCEKAVEVQKRKPEVGDFYAWPEKVEKEVDVLHEMVKEVLFGNSSYNETVATWLPRQDQLQEIVGTRWGIDYTHPCTFGEGMVAHIWEGCPEIQTYYWSMKTWEQFWLAIVMKEKYSKVWDATKKKWVARQVE